MVFPRRGAPLLHLLVSVAACTVMTFAAASTITACASNGAWSGTERAAFNAKYAQTRLELKVSCFYGDLYDDNEKWLLSPYPFAYTSHIVDLQGAPIHPTRQEGILPAGTQFVVQRVDFPGGLSNLTRMLTTPRFNPWLVLERIPQESNPTADKPFIAVLPIEEGSLQTAVEQLFGPPGTTSAWLRSVRPTVAVAIRHKDAVTGMNQAELAAAMGPPVRWFHEPAPQASNAASAARVAWYPTLEAWFEGNTVTRIKPPRSPSDPSG